MFLLISCSDDVILMDSLLAFKRGMKATANVDIARRKLEATRSDFSLVLPCNKANKSRTSGAAGDAGDSSCAKIKR